MKNIRAYELANQGNEEDNWKLGFHIMPPVGWINDPNGLCKKNGVYHVFFQYAPYYRKGEDLKCWGHYISENLIDWKYIGTPILPDQSYDKDGVYSGSAFVEDDVMHIFYTGNRKEEGDYDYILEGRGAATVHAICRDGVHVENKEVVIKDEEYPKTYSCHIRDPKVFKDQDRYYCVLGGRSKSDVGSVLLYESKDLTKWKLRNEFKTTETFGYMWECPDLFTIEQQIFLSVSPQGIKREEYRYQNVYSSGYFKVIGDFRGSSCLEEFQEWDYGFDFYAPQTFTDERKRRILLGWMGLPDIEEEYQNPSIQRGWIHCLTMFRELTVKEGNIYQYPVEEYKQLREDCVDMQEGNCVVKGNRFELHVDNLENKALEILLFEELVIEYKEEGTFEMSFLGNLGAGRTTRKAKVSTCSQVDVFVDSSAVEVYVNHGEVVYSTRIYPDKNETNVRIEGENCKGKIWKLAAGKTWGIEG